MDTSDEKKSPKPTAKPLTKAAIDRALKAGAAERWVDKGRKPQLPDTKIQKQPKRGKS